MTFTGPQARWFGTDGDDQRIKIVFLNENSGRLGDIGADDEQACLAGTWYERWRSLPDRERGALRTYTVRAMRPALGEVDVDMVCHGDAGPASRWLMQVRVGDEVIIGGPDVRSLDSAGGRDWHPGTAELVLLAGDETAAPAICAILENVDATRQAQAFIEVPTADDALNLTVPPGVDIAWLARDGQSRGELLQAAITQWATQNFDRIGTGAASAELDDLDVDREILWDSPMLGTAPDTCGRGERCGADFYAWFAGEAGVIKSLRRVIVQDFGVCRRRVAFMGYWRTGRSENT